MSDTPRTDAIIVDHPDDIGWTLNDFIGVVDAHFARTLEREHAAMREAIKEAHEALDDCREDTCELIAERDWWKDEPRCGYAVQYQKMLSRLAAAEAALAKLQPFITQ